MGEATALRLSKLGTRVVIADLPTSKGKEFAERIGRHAIFSPTDVTSHESVSRTLDLTHKTFGSYPFIVVNCAGVAIATRTLSKKGPHPLEEFMKVVNVSKSIEIFAFLMFFLKVNTVGTFNVIRLTSEKMSTAEPNERGERGVIINTASVAAFDGQIGQGILKQFQS